jgi:hypothetical protein
LPGCIISAASLTRWEYRIENFLGFLHLPSLYYAQTFIRLLLV